MGQGGYGDHWLQRMYVAVAWSHFSGPGSREEGTGRWEGKRYRSMLVSVEHLTKVTLREEGSLGTQGIISRKSRLDFAVIVKSRERMRTWFCSGSSLSAHSPRPKRKE